MAEYRHHPEIERLRVNENGSEVWLNDSLMPIKTQSTGKHPHRYVYYKGHKIALRKLILECWSGSLAPNKTITAKPINGDYSDYHYSNLEWGKVGGNSRVVKITPQLELDIMGRLDSGMSQCKISKELNIGRYFIDKIIKNREKEK